jgi:site-specific recombinase XerD
VVARAWSVDRLVFATRNGTEFEAGNLRRSFRRVFAAAGLDPGEWTPRELRRSFVSLLSAHGATVERIADLVGHAGTTRWS